MDAITTRSIPAHDGIPMACYCSDQGNTLLLFIHGWTCRRDYWLPQLEHFSSAWRVVAPDLPGHGESGSHGRSRWQVSDLGRDIAACTRALDAEQVILVGHSMGGAVALEAARILEARATGVVLVDTFVIDYGGLSRQAVEQIFNPYVDDFTGAIAGLIEQTSTSATPKTLKDRLIRKMSAADPSWALPLWRDLLAWDPSGAFEELQIPIHAINGALVPESARRRCAPFVNETIIPGAGHFLQMEDPVGFNRVLGEILCRFAMIFWFAAGPMI